MQQFDNHQELRQALSEAVAIDDHGVTVQNGERLKRELMEPLLATALFHRDAQLRKYCHWLIRSIANDLNILPAGLWPFYQAHLQGAVVSRCVPRFCFPGQRFEFARAIFAALKAIDGGLFLMATRLPEDESVHGTTLADFSSSILAAAVREGFHGPIFLELACEKTSPQLVEMARRYGFHHWQMPATSEDQVAALAALLDQLNSNGAQFPIASVAAQVDGSRGVDLIDVLTAQRQQRSTRAAGLQRLVWQSLEAMREGSIQVGMSLLQLSEPTVSNLRHLTQQQLLEIDLTDELLRQFLAAAALPKPLLEQMQLFVKDTWRHDWQANESEVDFLARNLAKSLAPFRQRFWQLDSAIKDQLQVSLTQWLAPLLNAMGLTHSRTLVRDTIRAVAQAVPKT